MDFITDLRNTKGYNYYWVVVDRFSKMAHFIPLKNHKAKKLVGILLHEICRLHGLPKRIVLDRDMVFMSSFGQEAMQLLEVVLNKLLAYHPQTDSQAE